MSIEEDFKEIVTENYHPKQEHDFFEGMNFIDIEWKEFIFNITLEKKEEQHNIILWGLAHKGDLSEEQKQFHGEYYKVIKKEHSRKELTEKIATLVDEACASYDQKKEKTSS